MFNSLFLKTDVTAIQIWKNFIFASVGGFVNIYDLNSHGLILKKEIFNGQKIYGFKHNKDGTKIIIYGGKDIALVSSDTKCRDLKIIISGRLSDWILDAKWIENDMKIITVFMHNKITIWTENITKEVAVKCEERCILYSAHIIYDDYKEIILCSGTVFSEILLWKPYFRTKEGFSPVLKRLRQHKGVIFSIHCSLDKGLLCSTSDDRSAILWKIKNPNLLPNLNPSKSDQLEIVSICQVYGHQSRVFRCFILSDSFVTAGEDSLLIIWSFKGQMVRKIDTHQGGPIWSLDYCPRNDVICTGGNDGAMSLSQVNYPVFTDSLSLPNTENPRSVGLLRKRNMVCLSENANLYYYNRSSQTWKVIANHSDLKHYSILQISPCRKMVALAGFEGQIYIYHNKNNALEKNYSLALKTESRIFSFHWLTCKTFLVCQNEGMLHLCFLYGQKIVLIQTFILPKSNERWSTCACLYKDHIIVGDRKGSIYIFKLGHQNPVNSIKKCHSHLGVTRVYVIDDTIISLGRDGILKRYKFFKEHFEYIDSNKTKFSWLAALENNYLVSFSGDNFVISDYKHQRILYETHCGGGHRSWDYLHDDETFFSCFIKQKVLHLIEFSLNDICPRDVIPGYHIHEINCIKALEFDDSHILISGGEDTILRISALKGHSHFQILESIKVHLSSIRSICLYKLPGTETAINKQVEYLLFTAGGRGQIICWHLQIKINNLGIILISCSNKYNFYEPLNKDEVETRIMDLSVVETNGQITLFTGCSNGTIKVFSVTENMELKYQNSIFSTFHSIIKLVNFSLLNTPLLLSTNTSGNVAFWNVLDIFSSNSNLSPFRSYRIHQSGINSYSYKIINNDYLLLLSGGDDNSIILTLFKFSKDEHDIKVLKVSFFEDKQIHCAQITGAYLGDKYFVTCSIDQRIVLWRWILLDNIITFQFIEKYDTAIADPQGIECFPKNDLLNLYIYGIGIEHLIVKVNQDSS